MNKFYVYRYIRNDSDTTFYVGKGSSNRANNLHAHNSRCVRTAKKYGHTIHIIKDNLNESDAFILEINTIKYYKDMGQCECNFSNGGQGISGHTHNRGRVHSAEARKSMGRKVGFTSHLKGIKFSNVRLQRHIQSIKNRKPVIDIVNGYIYESAKEASVIYNINYSSLKQKLNGRVLNNTNLKYIGEI